jgi:hypothetical protein
MIVANSAIDILLWSGMPSLKFETRMAPNEPLFHMAHYNHITSHLFSLPVKRPHDLTYFITAIV